MKRKQSSITAEGIALIRAYESNKPPDERICYDPLAIQFVRPWMRWLMDFFVYYGQRRSPGVMEYLVSRTRFIDDYLIECVNNGIQQLVILGAGFDSRAYRFKVLVGQASVFEVDHPATQAVKLAKLKRILGELPSNVRFVPVDFNTESLEKLLEMGYTPDLKTLYIWEGVTYYITNDAVDQTLEFIRSHSGKGSSVVLDYVYSGAIKGKLSRNELKSMRRYAGITGENIGFGIEEGKIEDFLQARGFEQVVNVNCEYFKRVYYHGAKPIAPVYAIVHAVIKA